MPQASWLAKAGCWTRATGTCSPFGRRLIPRRAAFRSRTPPHRETPAAQPGRRRSSRRCAQDRRAHRPIRWYRQSAARAGWAPLERPSPRARRCAKRWGATPRKAAPCFGVLLRNLRANLQVNHQMFQQMRQRRAIHHGSERGAALVHARMLRQHRERRATRAASSLQTSRAVRRQTIPGTPNGRDAPPCA